MLTIILFAGTHSVAATEILPPERSALVLYKSLPYNQAWSARDTIEVLIVAPSPDAAKSAEDYAAILSGIAAQATRQDPEALAVRTRVTSLDALAVDPFATVSPQLCFLLASSHPVDRDHLDTVFGACTAHSVLLATDGPDLLAGHAALGFLLSAERRPEIVIDLERARLQGARFGAGFVRLARTREERAR